MNFRLEMFLISSLSCILRRNNNSKVYLRRLHDAQIDVKDVNLKVPWGHVASRVWNGSDPSRKPVLCLHGWKDNAATWDRLIPMLISELPNHQFLAIDLPGHGFSSKIPDGMLYDLKSTITLVKRIVNMQGWNTFSIIGHSLGAQIGFLFSGVHSGIVEKYIAVDALTPKVWPKADISDAGDFIQQYLDLEEKVRSNKRPSYKYDVLLEKIFVTHFGSLDIESCKILMSRGTVESPKGSGLYQFTHDPRIHFIVFTYLSHRQISFIAKAIKSEVLFLEASHGLKYMSDYMRAHIEGWLRKRNERCVRFIDVNGGHHVHLTDPEQISPYICQVLAK